MESYAAYVAQWKSEILKGCCIVRVPKLDSRFYTPRVAAHDNCISDGVKFKQAQYGCPTVCFGCCKFIT